MNPKNLCLQRPAEAGNENIRYPTKTEQLVRKAAISKWIQSPFRAGAFLATIEHHQFAVSIPATSISLALFFWAESLKL